MDVQNVNLVNLLEKIKILSILGKGDPPFYANVDMRDGSILNTWVDALQVFF